MNTNQYDSRGRSKGWVKIVPFASTVVCLFYLVAIILIPTTGINITPTGHDTWVVGRVAPCNGRDWCKDNVLKEDDILTRVGEAQNGDRSVYLYEGAAERGYFEADLLLDSGMIITVRQTLPPQELLSRLAAILGILFIAPFLAVSYLAAFSPKEQRPYATVAFGIWAALIIIGAQSNTQFAYSALLLHAGIWLVTPFVIFTYLPESIRLGRWWYIILAVVIVGAVLELQQALPYAVMPILGFTQILGAIIILVANFKHSTDAKIMVIGLLFAFLPLCLVILRVLLAGETQNPYPLFLLLFGYIGILCWPLFHAYTIIRADYPRYARQYWRALMTVTFGLAVFSLLVLLLGELADAFRVDITFSIWAALISTLLVLVAILVYLHFLPKILTIFSRNNRQIILDMLGQTVHDKLITQEKMAALGQMVSGLAHEINTPLQTAVTDLGIITRHHDKIDVLSQAQHAQDQLMRIAELIDSIKRFSRPGRTEMTQVDLAMYLREALVLCDKHISLGRITLSTSIPGGLPPVYSSPSLLTNVFANLIINACDALQGVSDPTLSIAVENHEESVTVLIRDNGKGIAASDLPKLGNMFWTTKAHGTGLGLFFCYNVVTESGGKINFQSSEGKGTQVQVSFPIPQT